MSKTNQRMILVASLSLWGCAPVSLVPRDAGPPAVCDVPASAQALTAFLQSSQYRSFVSQPAIHASTTRIHAPYVRVYASPELATEPASATVHPVCSALVKEEYNSPTDTKPFGWAVSVKTYAPSTMDNPGDGWFWYEGGSGSQGDPVCTGCHSQGDDFVLTTLPLR